MMPTLRHRSAGTLGDAAYRRDRATASREWTFSALRAEALAGGNEKEAAPHWVRLDPHQGSRPRAEDAPRTQGKTQAMRCAIGLLLLALVTGPALAQKTKEPTLMEQIRPGVTYDDCVDRCNKCDMASGRVQNCVSWYCYGRPKRKPGAAPLPIVCPSYDG